MIKSLNFPEDLEDDSPKRIRKLITNVESIAFETTESDVSLFQLTNKDSMDSLDPVSKLEKVD